MLRRTTSPSSPIPTTHSSPLGRVSFIEVYFRRKCSRRHIANRDPPVVHHVVRSRQIVHVSFIGSSLLM
eukprot:scaffold66558_cov30-Tisochrysis_lutea.AAC.2